MQYVTPFGSKKLVVRLAHGQEINGPEVTGITAFQPLGGTGPQGAAGGAVDGAVGSLTLAQRSRTIC